MGFGTGTYDGQELSSANPLRRDTFTVPSGGWLMLRYISDNRACCCLLFYISCSCGDL